MKKYSNITLAILYIFAICVFIPIDASAQRWRWKTTDSGLVYEVNDGIVTIINWKGKGKHVFIPDDIDGMPVEKVFSFYFFHNNQKKIESIVLPKNMQELFWGGVAALNEDQFYARSVLTVVEIPSEMDIKDEFSFPRYFSAWYQLHGRSAGRYTYKDGMWYLDGNPPPTYAECRIVDQISIISVNGVEAKQFRNRGSYILTPGSNDITYRVSALWGGTMTITNTVVLEAGKYEIRFLESVIGLSKLED